MDFHIALGIFSSLFLIAASVPYIFDILKKRARPNLVSWIGWTFLTTIGAAAQIAKGPSLSVLVPIILTFSELTIVILALRHGHAKFNTTDKICFALAALAVALWAITKEPLIALGLSLLADFIVGIPTILKTYRDPRSETVLPWVLYAVGPLLGLFASSNFELQNVLYPAYLACYNSLVSGLAIRGRLRKN